MNSYENFLNWPIPKQYLAAHFYLSQQKPITITQSQKAQLGALHLFVTHGPYTPFLQIEQLRKCTSVERRKRIESWNKLGNMSKHTAMRMFIDIVSKLFPWWFRYKGLYSTYQIEWEKLREIQLKKKQKDKLPLISPKTEIPIQIQTNIPKVKYKSLTPRCIQQVKQFQKSRFSSIKPLKLNANTDIQDTLFRLKKYTQNPLNLQKTEKSIHYRNRAYHQPQKQYKQTYNFSMLPQTLNRESPLIEIPEKQEEKIPVQNSIQQKIKQLSETIDYFEQELLNK